MVPSTLKTLKKEALKNEKCIEKSTKFYEIEKIRIRKNEKRSKTLCVFSKVRKRRK